MDRRHFSRARALVVAACVLLGLAAPATAAVAIAPAAAAVDPTAAALLQRFRAASGGAAWDAVHGLHTRGTVSTGGLSGSFEAWEEVTSGRSFTRFHLGPVEGAEGFDGDAPWSRDPSGEVVVERSTEGLEMARDDAYRTALGWWFPERWPATIRALGERAEAERRFDVVEITPAGGRPFELWIDRASGLADRAIERGGIETSVTTFADWRPVGAVRLPFRMRTGNGDAHYDTLMQVESIDVDPTLDTAMFAPPSSRADDFAIAGGTSAVVPFALGNNHVYIDVSVDGSAPLPMLLDSGGFNVLTPETAKRLGIHGQGALQGRGVGEGSTDVALAKVGRVTLGPVEMRDQVFYLLPLAGMEEVEGRPVAGVVGFELLQRFVVSIDYAAHRLTVTVPESFDAAGAGTAIPFVFADHMPAVEGSVDGIAGRFTIDTGSRGALALHQPFVEAHDLVARYRPPIEAVTGYGVGGGVRAKVTQAGELRLGPVAIRAPVTELVLSEKGALADRYLAGNVGGGVLRRFRVTFDYRHERLYLLPYGDAADEDPFDRAGLWLVPQDGALVVEDVVPGGPGAAAGIYPGDRIVGVGPLPAKEAPTQGASTQGAPTQGAPLPDADLQSLERLRARLRADPPGTRVTLRVRGGPGEKDPVREVSFSLFALAAQPATPAPTPTGQLTPVPPSPQ